LLALLPKQETDAKQDLLRSLKLVAKQTFDSRKIEEYTKTLNKFREQISFHVVLSLKHAEAQHFPATSRKLDSIQTDIKTILSLFEANGNDLHTVSPKYDEVVQRCVDLPTQARLDTIDNLTSEKDSQVKRNTMHKRQAILNLLIFRQMADRFDEVADAYSRTFDWIFESPDEAAWDSLTKFLQKDSDLPYWINGKAGSGKSTIMRYIARHPITQSALEDWRGSSQLETAHFFSWYLGTDLQKSHQGLLQALLHQILERRQSLIHQVFPNIWHSINPTCVQLDPLSPTEVKRAFSSLLELSSKTLKLCFFIDGVDEFHSDHEDIATFLKNMSSPSVKLILSSRPIPVCVDIFENCPSMRLQDLTQRDIRIYVQGKLESHPDIIRMVARQPWEVRELVQEVIEMASGVFLWVKLVVTSLLSGLRNGDRIADLQDRLRALPPDLEDLFKHMLDRMDPMYQTQAAELFQLVRAGMALLSNRALPTAFMSFADLDPRSSAKARICDFHIQRVAERCHELEKRLRSRCCGLLELVPVARPLEWWSESLATLTAEEKGLISTNIQYLHRTVAEYLYQEDVWKGIVDLTAASGFNLHQKISNACLHMLKLTPLQENFSMDTELWTWAKALLSCERQYGGLKGKAQVKVLDELDRVMTERYAAASDVQAPFWGQSVELRLNAGCGSVGSLIQRPLGSFLSLAASTGLPHYLDEKLHRHGLQRLGLPSQAALIQIMFSHLGDGWTSPLSAQVKTVEVLLRHGADPNEASAGPSFWQIVLHYLRSMQKCGQDLEGALGVGSRPVVPACSRHKQATSLFRNSINQRQVLFNPENLPLLLSWGQVARLCIKYGANAKEIVAFRISTQGTIPGQKLQMSDIWPIFSSNTGGQRYLDPGEFDESVLDGSSTKSMQVAISILGAELESLLLERGALDIDAADAEAAAIVDNGYLLEKYAFADVLFPELEHRAQDSNASSDSGSEQDVPEPLNRRISNNRKDGIETRAVKVKIATPRMEDGEPYAQFSGNPDAYASLVSKIHPNTSEGFDAWGESSAQGQDKPLTPSQ